MSLRFSRTWGQLGLALLGAGGLALGTARAAETGPAESPETPRPAAVTNFTRLPARRDGLQRLEDRLADFFKSFVPKRSVETSLDPQFAPQAVPRVIVPDQRTKDKINEERNWMYKNPADLGKTPAEEDAFKVPGLEDREKARQTPIEAFYQSLMPQPPGSKLAKPGEEEIGSARKRTAAGEDVATKDDKTPATLRTTEQNLRKALEKSGSFDAKPGSDSLADLMRQAAEAARLDGRPEESPYLKEYRQLLQGAASGGGASGLPGGFGADAAQRMPGFSSTTADSAGTPRRDLFDPTSGSMTPRYSPDSLADINSRVLNQWNPLYRAPQVEPPKVTPPKPNFDAPRRKF